GRASDLLALALAHGKTVKASAALAGVPRRLAFLRLKSPEFQRLLVQARARLHLRNRGLLATAQAEAVARLRELAGSDDEGTAVKAAGLLLKATLPPKLAGEL